MRERGSTIERVLDILEQVAIKANPVSASEINQVLKLPRSSTHRICASLEQQGYLQRCIDGKRFIPGPKLRGMVSGLLAHSTYRVEQHAILSSLSSEIGETCNLAHPDGVHMIYSDRVETQWPLRLQFPVGSRVPLYCTASGKM